MASSLLNGSPAAVHGWRSICPVTWLRGFDVLGVLGAFGLVPVSTLAISWAIVLVSVLVASPEKVQIFCFVVLFPLTFTSNAFVPTASMPGWLQAWSNVNPVTILSDKICGLLVSKPVATPTMQALLWAIGFTVVFAPLAVRAFMRRT